jgi:spore coat protein U-like protein
VLSRKNKWPGYARLLMVLLGAVSIRAFGCTLDASSLSFPNYDPSVPYATTGVAILTITCKTTTSLAVEITGGRSGGGTFAMTHASRPSQLTYGVFADPGLTRPWSSVPIRVPVGRSGVGTAWIAVYGAINPRQDVWVGTYSDYLTVTVLP